MTERMVLFGGGGHAKVVLEALQATEPDLEIALLDDDPAAQTRKLLHLSVRGDRAWLETNWPEAAVMPAIGSNEARAGLIEWLVMHGRRIGKVVHSASVVSPTASIGEGCFVAPGAVINAEARLGKGVIVNTSSSVDHDCIIDDCAHIAPGTRLCGGVTIGARTLIGAGSVVIPGISIGSDVTIGAGSVVIADIASGGRFAGAPARPI